MRKKILWVCNLIFPEVAKQNNLPINNSGGWLIGLSKKLSNNTNFDLTICTPYQGGVEIIKNKIENINFILVPNNIKNSTKYNYRMENHFKNIFTEINPDLVHIFGTELPHTLAAINGMNFSKTVISIQGLVSVYSKHYFADLPNKVIHGKGLYEIITGDTIKKQKKVYEVRGIYEHKAIEKTNYIIGRTDWDKACTFRINPNVKYFECNETLRDSFYGEKWKFENIEKYSVFVSQGYYPIKGLHYVLQGFSEILRVYPEAHLYIAGIDISKNIQNSLNLRASSYSRYLKKLIHKYSLNNHVTFLGSLNEEEMKKRYLKTHVFLIPSSIENSPNSLGEAMLLGVPCVASYVGGINSMMSHNIDGFLYQHNASYMISYYINRIFSDLSLAEKFSENSRNHASITHNKDLNNERLMEIYNYIINI